MIIMFPASRSFKQIVKHTRSFPEEPHSNSLVKKSSILSMFGVVVVIRIVMASVIPPAIVAITVLEDCFCQYFYKRSFINPVK